MDRIRPYAKAVVGFVTPGAIALGAAVQSGTPGGSGVTAAEWITIAVACVVTGGAVFSTPNRPQYDPRHDVPGPEAFR